MHAIAQLAPPPKPKYVLTDTQGGKPVEHSNIHLCNLSGFLLYGMSQFRIWTVEEYQQMKKETL